MPHAVVLGGSIIGAATALMLERSGWQVTVVSVIAAGATTPAGLVAGWNQAALVTAAVSVVGALVVLGTRVRR